MLDYVASFVEGLGVMASSSNPNVSSTIDNPLPTCVGYNSSPSVDNLQPLHEGRGLGNSNYVVDEQTIVALHLEDFWKQRASWKPHFHNSPTWSLFQGKW